MEEEKDELIQELADELEDYLELYLSAINMLESYGGSPPDEQYDNWDDFICGKWKELHEKNYA